MNHIDHFFPINSPPSQVSSLEELTRSSSQENERQKIFAIMKKIFSSSLLREDQSLKSGKELISFFEEKRFPKRNKIDSKVDHNFHKSLAILYEYSSSTRSIIQICKDFGGGDRHKIRHYRAAIFTDDFQQQLTKQLEESPIFASQEECLENFQPDFRPISTSKPLSLKKPSLLERKEILEIFKAIFGPFLLREDQSLKSVEEFYSSLKKIEFPEKNLINSKMDNNFCKSLSILYKFCSSTQSVHDIYKEFRGGNEHKIRAYRSAILTNDFQQQLILQFKQCRDSCSQKQFSGSFQNDLIERQLENHSSSFWEEEEFDRDLSSCLMLDQSFDEDWGESGNDKNPLDLQIEAALEELVEEERAGSNPLIRSSSEMIGYGPEENRSKKSKRLEDDFFSPYSYMSSSSAFTSPEGNSSFSSEREAHSSYSIPFFLDEEEAPFDEGRESALLLDSLEEEPLPISPNPIHQGESTSLSLLFNQSSLISDQVHRIEEEKKQIRQILNEILKPLCGDSRRKQVRLKILLPLLSEVFPKELDNLIKNIPKFIKCLYEFSFLAIEDYSDEMKHTSKATLEGYRRKIQDSAVQEVLKDLVKRYKKGK